MPRPDSPPAHGPFRIGLPLAVLISVLLASAGTSFAQIADPVPGPIPVGDLAVPVELVALLPDSGPGGNPRARPMMISGDRTGRTFVADQNGFVLRLHSDGSTTVFLDLTTTNLLADQGQRGLASFAFHPDYHNAGTDGSGRFYTAIAEPLGSGTPDYPAPVGAPTSHHSVIYEWQVSPDPEAIDPATAREILRIVETYSDHNMGDIKFDPNLSPSDPDYGLLHIAMGDGGNVCCPRPSVDPHLTGQALSSPLGTILRIDPLEPAGGSSAYSIPGSNPFATDGDPTTLDEIWAYGLRNPHKFSWDRGESQSMLISDIGQANVEEINLGAIGANYGWSEREGTFAVMHFNEDDVFALPPGDGVFGYTYPVIQYDHDEDDRAITGGFVQRGSASGLEGHYVFGDLTSGRVFHAPVSSLDGSVQAPFEQLRLIDQADGQEKSLLEMVGGGTPAPRADLRFGIDDLGHIYLGTKRDGAVRRLVVAPLTAPGLQAPGTWVLATALAAIGLAVHRSRRRDGCQPESPVR